MTQKRTFEQMWNEFRDLSIPDCASEDQRLGMELAFLSGAMSYREAVALSLDNELHAMRDRLEAHFEATHVIRNASSN